MDETEGRRITSILSTISLLQKSSHLTHPADAGKVKII
jgi:hypothetical protein